MENILDTLELMKESAEDDVIDVFDIRRVMKVMFNEEIVIDSLNLNEKQIKTCKTNLEFLLERYLEMIQDEEEYEIEEKVKMMMNQY